MGRRAVVLEVRAARESRVLRAGQLLSAAGDQLARVAIAVLVYQQTSSPAWTALAYALSLLPTPPRLVSGRALVVGGVAARAVVAGLLALTPALPYVLVLAGVLGLAAGPVRGGPAGRVVLWAHVAGLLAGGATLTFAGQRIALGLTALIFAGAAVAHLAGRRTDPGHAPAARVVAGPAWRDRRLRWLLVLAWLTGLFAVPAGLAAPYAGGDAAWVGALMAALPAGGAAGAWLAGRLPESRRPAALVVLGVAAGLPLAACLLDPPLPVVLALWAVAGACAAGCYFLAQGMLVRSVPEPCRGAVSELARAGVSTSLGVAVLGAGVLAGATSPVSAVGAGGMTGAVLTAVVWVSWLRTRADTSHELVLTSPKPASSTPPPIGEATVNGHNGLTSPTPASETPPSQALAAARGNGTAVGRNGVTSPIPASSAPPSGKSAAEHGIDEADRVVVSRPHPSASTHTDQRSRHPARWALWREPTRLLVLILLVETVAVLLTIYRALHTTVTANDLVALGVITGLGLAMGELTRHVERVRRRFNDTPHVNLTSVWIVAAILVVPAPLVLVVIGSLYLHLFWRSWYRVRSVHAYRLVFTASTVVLATYATSALRHLLAPADLTHWSSPAAVLSIALAGLVYTGVNWGLVVIAITLHERQLSMRKALGTGREAALEFGTIGLGTVTALLISMNPGWALMMVPALLVLHRSVLMRQLEEAASTDQKTGLANATAWTNMAATEIQRARRDGTEVGVLMVDLDHFKQVNDAHGHLVGDRVLQAVAETLTSCARRYDVVGRWGGEEFVVLCPEVSGDELRKLGERVCALVRDLRVPLGEPGRGAVEGLSVSVGLALYPEFGPDLQDVLLAADDALFVAKDSGRNQVQTIIAAIGDLGVPRASTPGP
jgi:diguanylate cyclase (GGDEF)-like protein